VCVLLLVHCSRWISRLYKYQYGEFLNAEGAKVTRRAQKKEAKMEAKKTEEIEFNCYFYLYFSKFCIPFFDFFCVLRVTFAPFAFKKSPLKNLSPTQP
jgi:hypothetical protein